LPYAGAVHGGVSVKGAEEKRITGAASTIGSATVVSRMLGYARDASIAFVFGAGMYSDVFFMAFRIANLLRRLVGEGALTSSLIPIFTEELGVRTRDGAARMVSSVFTVFGGVLVLLALLGVIFSGLIVRLMAPGFAADPARFALTVNLTRLMFPYMVFIGLMAVAMGVLHTMRHFTAPAVAPVFFNLSLIASVFVLAPLLETPVYALAYGVIIGGVFQLAIQFPFLKRYAMTPRLLFEVDPAIKKILLLMGPAAFGVGIYQLNIFVTLWFASQLEQGSLSYLYYAGRLMELPLGVFVVSISTAVLPSLSEHAAARDWQAFRGSLSFALRMVDYVTIPATAGLFVLSYPIIEVLFARGEFGAIAASGTSTALYYYTLGLVPVSISRVLTSVFYSLKDTRTPVWIAFVSFVVNVFLCILLVGPLSFGGLALAASLSAMLNAGLLLLVLRARFGPFGGREVLGSALRSLGATAVMTALIALLLYASDFGSQGTAAKAMITVACLITGVVSYIALSRALKAPEAAFLKEIVGRRER